MGFHGFRRQQPTQIKKIAGYCWTRQQNLQLLQLHALSQKIRLGLNSVLAHLQRLESCPKAPLGGDNTSPTKDCQTGSSLDLRLPVPRPAAPPIEKRQAEDSRSLSAVPCGRFRLDAILHFFGPFWSSLLLWRLDHIRQCRRWCRNSFGGKSAPSDCKEARQTHIQ